MNKKFCLLASILVFIIFFIFIWAPQRNKLIAQDILLSGTKLYSEHNEELIIRDFFQDRRNGFFVDVGCAHYMHASTTFYLEKHLGWSGIAIDALDEFENDYLENRPNTKFFNYIVTDHSGTKDFFYRLSDNGVWYSSVDKRFVEKVAKSRNDIKSVYQKLEVPTITLTELLEKSEISKIDFLSMDIEGGEPKALAGFDINRFRPELVCIEAHSNKRTIMKYFTRNGYEFIEKYLIYDNLNLYFRPKN